MPIKRNHSPGNPRMSVANQLELSPEAEAELLAGLMKISPFDVTPRAELNRVVAELTHLASFARAASGLRISRGGAPFKVGLQALMSDVARIVSRYGIPVTGWQHDGGLESRLFAVFRLIARAAGLYPAADPRQIYKQAKLIERVPSADKPVN